MKAKLKISLVFSVAILLLLGIASVSFAGGGQEAAETTVTDDVKRLRSAWSFPTFIDPAVGADFSSSTALIHLYDTLVYPDENMMPQPQLSEKWDISADGKNYTFYLRKDVKFHDGSVLTSEDVKFSMERLMAIGEGFGFLFTSRVVKIDAPDDYTISFTLKEPFAPFLGAMYRFYILNKDVVMANIEAEGPYGEMGDYGKQFLLEHDAGSGPYVVKEFPLEEYLLMSKYNDYWQELGPDTADEIQMIGTIEPVTIRTMMARRELEISDAWQSEEAFQTLDNIEGIDIASYSTGNEWYLMVHNRKPPTDDVHFRKAMSYAFDYDTMLTFFPGFIQARGPIPQNIPGANPNLIQYHRDLDKAKEELKKSKYYDDLDEYTVDFHWNGDVPVTEKVALLFMSNMADIGINVEMTKSVWLSMVENSSRPETSPHILIVNDTPQYPEAGALLESRYKSETAPTWEQNEWLLDPVYDEMVEEALRTVDDQERFAKYAVLQEYIMDLCPSIYLVEMLTRHAYQSEYLEAPVFNGLGIPFMGYDLDSRFINVFPEKRMELIK